MAGRNCLNCGAHLYRREHAYICEHCGTHYPCKSNKNTNPSHKYITFIIIVILAFGCFMPWINREDTTTPWMCLLFAGVIWFVEKLVRQDQKVS